MDLAIKYNKSVRSSRINLQRRLSTRHAILSSHEHRIINQRILRTTSEQRGRQPALELGRDGTPMRIEGRDGGIAALLLGGAGAEGLAERRHDGLVDDQRAVEVVHGGQERRQVVAAEVQQQPAQPQRRL